MRSNGSGIEDSSIAQDSTREGPRDVLKEEDAES
jgi:hypothetical protein